MLAMSCCHTTPGSGLAYWPTSIRLVVALVVP